MSRWKYHLNPNLVRRGERIGVYCPICHKLCSIVSAKPILALRKNNGKDLSGIGGLISVTHCKYCNMDVRIDIFKHLVRVDDENHPIPPVPRPDKYTSLW